MKRLFTIFFLVLVSAFILYAQSDTVKYHWPVKPLHTSQTLSATFAEFRNTGSSDHFHNAVDIPEPDGNPCYPGIDGIVHSVVTDLGSNSYVSVRTQVDGKWKRLTYLHIKPSNSVYVGQTVKAGETILGYIYSGMGHVHLIERELTSSTTSSGVAINNIREGGGLTPLIDTWAPKIFENTLEFRIHDTDYKISKDGLAGRVDMIIRAEEVNGNSSIGSNNGVYILGYRVWDTDTSTIIYEPEDSGVKYRFDRMPSNTYVHNVFVQGKATLSDPIYWLTNGNGADGINSSLIVEKNYWDTDRHEAGDYLLEVFAGDTRGNHTKKFIPIKITGEDVTPPERPLLYTIENHNKKKGVTVKWKKNGEFDIMGYRLYYTENTNFSNWKLAADENQLNTNITEYEIDSPAEFIEPSNIDVYIFMLTAVDSAGNESERSDIYTRSSYMDGTEYPTALIVDGFDRTTGSYKGETHYFNVQYFGPMLFADSIVISSCANDAVIDNKISLENYDMVVWFLGDESTSSKTFKSIEQFHCATYLENGGNLFVSGSEVGWDLDRKHNTSQNSDTLFYRHYLKSRLMHDGNSLMTKAEGAGSSFFDGIQLNFGQVYDEDYPDDIEPINGAETIMFFNADRDANSKRIAGISYNGPFGESSVEGKMVYISFPLETVGSFTERMNFMQKVMQYFGVITNVENDYIVHPNKLELKQNYPNPFNPSTNLEFIIAKTEMVNLTIFDVLGRQVDVLVDEVKNPGMYKTTWNASRFSSGVYFARLQSGTIVKTISMILVK